MYSLTAYNQTYLTYEYRYNTTNWATNETYYAGDSIMNSRWLGFSLPVKGMAFIPALLAFVCFGILISYFGRWKPTPKDPHAGRLKKRRKRKSRLVRMWQRISRRRSHTRGAHRSGRDGDGGATTDEDEGGGVGEGDITLVPRGKQEGDGGDAAGSSRDINAEEENSKKEIATGI